MAEHSPIHIGTSGWQYREWRGRFYPQGLPVREWFRYYAERFHTVEINSTFYHLAPIETFTKWSRQAPPGFLYAVKASRILTHLNKLADAVGTLAHMMSRLRRLGPHLGPILYQLPPHWRCDVERLRSFIALLPADLDHVFEFRDPSWHTEAVHDVLTAAHASFCIHDLQDCPCPEWLTGRVAYVRLHGPTALKYTGSYDAARLRHWAAKARDFADTGRPVFVYFNNTMEGHAAINAQELQQLVERRMP